MWLSAEINQAHMMASLKIISMLDPTKASSQSFPERQKRLLHYKFAVDQLQ